MATTKTPKSAALKKDSGKASTAVAVRPAMNVVSIQETLKAQAAAMNERTNAASGNKIKGAKGMFNLPNGQSVKELDVVIVDFNTFHAFYPGKFDARNIKPPVCFAIGSNPKDMTPSANSPDKQSGDCQSCPQNAFPEGGGPKACKNGRKLAVLPANDAGNDVDHEAEMWVLEVSPTALKGFDGYVRSLSTTFQLPPAAFLTTVTLDESVDYAKVQFSNPRPIDSLGEVLARQAEAKAMLAAEPDVSGYEAAYKPAAKTPARKVANARR